MRVNRRPYDASIRAPDTCAFIKCDSCREPMTHELWCKRIDKICREVHPIARIEITDVTVEELITEYLNWNRRCNWIIREIYINISVQFMGLQQILGSGLPFIENFRASETTRGWGSTGSTNTSENSGRSTHISTAYSSQSPVS